MQIKAVNPHAISKQTSSKQQKVRALRVENEQVVHSQKPKIVLRDQQSNYHHNRTNVHYEQRSGKAQAAVSAYQQCEHAQEAESIAASFRVDLYA